MTTGGGAVIFAADLLEADTAFDERRHVGIVCYFNITEKRDQFLLNSRTFPAA
jgi:hypothetical protein